MGALFPCPFVDVIALNRETVDFDVEGGTRDVSEHAEEVVCAALREHSEFGGKDRDGDRSTQAERDD